MYYIGYDIGSSSVKTALVNASSGKIINVPQEPEREMDITILQIGWANKILNIDGKKVCKATHKL